MTDDRYSRQVLFPGIGREGQLRIRQASVAVVGCGALGTVSCEMLTRGGLGRLIIVDRDFVETSNLQRQTLFDEEDAAAALPKAIAAKRRLQRINSDVEIDAQVADLTAHNLPQLLSAAQIVVDASDNFELRYLVNDWAFQQGIPWIYGACVAGYGIAFPFQPGLTGCLQCLFPEPPEPGSLDTCETAGIIAPVVHAVASFQVAQTLKLLAGQPVLPNLFHCDVWEASYRSRPLDLPDRSGCPCCGRREFRFLEGKRGDRSVRLCGRDAVQISPPPGKPVDFERVRARLARSAPVQANEFMLRFQVEGYEISLFPDGRSIVRGTSDPARARSLYARYIGR